MDADRIVLPAGIIDQDARFVEVESLSSAGFDESMSEIKLLD
jgi:hypothetical protein